MSSLGPGQKTKQNKLKVALRQKRLEDFYISKINIPNHYREPKSVNNLFKFSAQDSDLEYLFWRCKNPPVSSDLKPPLGAKGKSDETPYTRKSFSLYLKFL